MPSRNTGSGAITPILPMTGSRMSAAGGPGAAWNASSTDAKRLNLAIRVCPAIAEGTPAESGTPNV